jgi:hypothetical protein
MFKMMFSLKDTNNAVLSGVNAMPQKDITSDGTSTFAGARHEYFQTVPNTVGANKRWFGNRDASQVAANRRVREIGVGSMNASNGPMAFVAKNDRNSRIDALARVRGGGAVVPPKVRHRGGQSGVPMGTADISVPVIRTQHRLAMIPTQDAPGKPYVPFRIRAYA